MNTKNDWSETAPQVIYEAYPDHDVLLIEPPKQGETIGSFKVRAEDAGDTLFLFLCREADDDIDAHEYIGRLERAVRDIKSVRHEFRKGLSPAARACALSPADKLIASLTAKKEVTIRLSLDDDWIELAVTCDDAHVRRSGSVSSSLHSSEDEDDRFNAAVDAIESMVLAHACAGIDVTDPRYVEGVRTCVECCATNL